MPEDCNRRIPAGNFSREGSTYEKNSSRFSRRFCAPSVAGAAASSGWNGLVFSFGASVDIVES